eukprot:TRINITY_DN10009_c0_g3_i1.p1 TRINITY_DN10009_c0_g3~~TRINITY_DN10009_c0_g3_i1.p1  ORF type:complete len:191 (+),score=29.32 TRINITY_DN10009_c0_g3_i1:108-680(+)
MPESSSSDAPISRRIRPVFAGLLVVEAVLLVLRWCVGDQHGALLMLAVLAIGVLSFAVGTTGIDVIYAGYFGLMAFVSGLIDLNTFIEKLARELAIGPPKFTRNDLVRIGVPTLYLISGSVHLFASFTAYLLYKESEVFESNEDDVLWATPHEARMYHSVMAQAQQSAAVAQPMSPEARAFVGKSYKLSA